MNIISGALKTKPLIDPARYGRSDRSALGRWFWEIDRVLLLLVAVLIGIGLVAVAAASPAAAQRYSGGSVTFAPLHYFYRQLVWIALSVPVMIFVSMMPRERAKRLSLIGAALFLVAMMFVPLVGPEINGAQRWIGVGFTQFQPSEFLKPFYVVAMAALLSLRERDKSLPVFWLSGGFVGVIAVLLMIQPDFGSTIIFCAVWVAMIALAGVNLRVLAGMSKILPERGQFFQQFLHRRSPLRPLERAGSGRQLSQYSPLEQVSKESKSGLKLSCKLD